MSQGKAYVVQDLLAVDGFGQTFNRENFVADLTVRTEIDIRVFTAGRTDIVELNFF